MNIRVNEINNDKLKGIPGVSGPDNHVKKNGFEAQARGVFYAQSDGRELIKTNSYFEEEDENKNISSVASMELDSLTATLNYMTLMANTLSDEDYKKLSEDGFDISSMDPKEAVTIVDKIKAELAKAGVEIKGYNDDLDISVLSEALGSAGLAGEVIKSFNEADVPVTKDNVSKVLSGLELASKISAPTEEEILYMVKNAISADLEGLFVAKNAGVAKKADGVKHIANISTKEKEEMLTRAIVASGLRADSKNLKIAERLFVENVPVTKENIVSYREIEEIEFPLDAMKVIKSSINALSDEKPIEQALLTNNESALKKAVYFYNLYNESNPEEVFPSADMVKERRVLEEIKLKMTVETNLKMIKSGFEFAHTIDTEDMENLLENLKAAEKDIAGGIFTGSEDALGKYELFNKTVEIVKNAPFAPVDIIGRMSNREVNNLEQFDSTAKSIRGDISKLSREYEAVMTRPNSEYGDSIKKAFANVDEILSDLEYDTNPENRRLIRILGYNGMEITPENIEKVRKASDKIMTVIHRMTPAVTLKMIRDNINPLTLDFGELKEYLDENGYSYEREASNFARFLYENEKNGKIDGKERESYIGIYRLINKIEKTDGAVIGTLVNIGADLSFKNILSAVRVRRMGSFDLKVYDELEMKVKELKSGDSISDQINAAFNKNEKYADEELDAFVKTEHFEAKEVAGELNDIPMQFLKEEYAKFIYRDANVLPDSEDEFEKNYTNSLEEIESEIESSTENEVSDLNDLKTMRAFHKMTSMALNLKSNKINGGERKEFFFPLSIGEKLCGIKLTIENTSGFVSNIRIHTKSEEMEMEADIDVYENVIFGKVKQNSALNVMNLDALTDIFNSNIRANNKNSDYLIELKDATAKGYAVNGRKNVNFKKQDTNALYSIAKEFLKAVTTLTETTEQGSLG